MDKQLQLLSHIKNVMEKSNKKQTHLIAETIQKSLDGRQ